MPGVVPALSRKWNTNGCPAVPDIIRVIMFFNRERFDDTRHPHTLYRQQKVMVRQFKEDCNKSPSPMDVLIPKLPEFLRLADNICKATPDAAGKLSPPFEFGRMKVDPRRSVRAGSRDNRGNPMYFIGGTMDYKVANGWLLPMLAAFRANLSVIESPRGHCWGLIRCPHGRGGCQKSIWSTPKSPQNHANQIRRYVDKCAH